MSRHCKDCRWKNELVDQPHCRNCVAFSNWSPELDSMPSTIRKYIENNIESPYAVQHAIYNSVINSKKHSNSIPAIKDVIFNPPATIIIWEDKTKTVVKCGEYDVYDPEKGMAMAIARKALGDKGSYYNTFEKWLKPYYKKRLDKFVEDACLGNLSKIGCVTVDFGSDNVKIVNAETGEVSESDICEYDHKEKDIDKRCSNCKYGDGSLDDELCDTCTIPMCGAYDNHWTPKESDD